MSEDGHERIEHVQDDEGAAVVLTVNGTRRQVDAGPETPLVYALRNDLRLVGARFGCGANQCGACYVLVDGHAVPSCDTPIWSVGSAEVTTVEGLADDALGRALQQAFLEEQAGQCGYCLSGIILAATALLRATPEPSEGEVRAALDRHLCRCGSHNRIVRAVMKAAAGALR